MIGPFESLIAADNAARLHNHQRLRELATDHGDEVRIFCAHDHAEFERARSAAA